MSSQTLILIIALSGLLIGGYMVRQRLSRYWQCVLGSNWFDFIVPWRARTTQEQIKESERRVADSLAVIREGIQQSNLQALQIFREQLITLMNIEAERRTSVDGRLSAIVGLASIAGAVATGVMVAQAAGTFSIPNSYVRCILSASAFYLILQLCDAIYWAVRGQERQGYRTDRVEDLLSKPGVSEEHLLRVRLATWVEQLGFNQDSVNQKVTAMAVAHRAAKNFIWGLLVLSAISMLITIFKAPEAPVVAALRADAKLREQLRGPVGPAGPQGIIGPAGPLGATGAPGDPGAPGHCTAIKDCQVRNRGKRINGQSIKPH